MKHHDPNCYSPSNPSFDMKLKAQTDDKEPFICLAMKSLCKLHFIEK